MSSHNHHPAIREHGLQDDCPRCREHAKEPWATLDAGNLLDLAGRTEIWMRDEDDISPRSENEATAMRLMEAHIVHARILARAYAEATV